MGSKRNGSLIASLVVFSLTTGVVVLPLQPPAEAQCLDRAACRDIKAEVAELRPELREARQELRQLQRALRSLPKGSDRWLTQRKKVKRAKKAFRGLKREHRALKLDFRHHGCANC